MFGIIENFRTYRKRLKANRHLLKLKSTCVFGEGFCLSPSYRDNLLQLLNVRITNMTNNRDKIVFGEYCNVSVNLFLNSRGSVLIGDYVFMNSVGLRIDHNLKIGSHCMFGPNVTLIDTKNHPLDFNKRHEQCEHIAHNGFIDSYQAGGGDITIGDDVWIGMNCIVLGGVTIGNGSVVAAGSVVTRCIPEKVLVGGIPARIIKKI